MCDMNETIESLRQQLATMTAHNVMLRDAIKPFAEGCWSRDLQIQAREALAATEADLGGLIMCEKEPVGIWHAGDTDEESDFFIFSEAGDISENCTRCTKLYRAKEQGK